MILNKYPDLEAYIEANYVSEDELNKSNYKLNIGKERKSLKFGGTISGMSEPYAMPRMMNSSTMPSPDKYDIFQKKKKSALDERMKHLSDSFQEYLFYLIKEKSLNNAEVYKRAIITKQTFSKIKKNVNYHPDKSTAMRLCVGLELNLDETKDLLLRAGYALSPCDKRDVIFSYFIEKEIYDMIEIDIALEEYGLPCFIE